MSVIHKLALAHHLYKTLAFLIFHTPSSCARLGTDVALCNA